MLSHSPSLSDIKIYQTKKPNRKEHWNPRSVHKCNETNVIDVRVLVVDRVSRSSIKVKVLGYCLLLGFEWYSINAACFLIAGSSHVKDAAKRC